MHTHTICLSIEFLRRLIVDVHEGHHCVLFMKMNHFFARVTASTDLEVQTGSKKRTMRFFLTDLGNQQLILGYPWHRSLNLYHHVWV
jgi:hypothetical protein